MIYPSSLKEEDNEEVQIENLIDGIANCCRRKPENALGILFDCCCANNQYGTTANATDLVKLCYSLTVASEVLTSRRIDETYVKSFQQNFPELHGLAKSLMKKVHSTQVTKEEFLTWGTEVVPFIYSTLTTFTHKLIFHGKFSKSSTSCIIEASSYCNPKLVDSSDIFDKDPSLVFTICCMAPNMGGKVSHSRF